MHKRVLLTGGRGYIGHHTVPYLIDKGFEIHIATSTLQHSNEPHVFFHSVNLLDENQHDQLMKDVSPTHLLHLAWYTENGKFWDAIQNIHWLKASIALAETFFKWGGKRLVATGTCAEYDWQEGDCREEVTRENPTSLYGKIKKSTYECLNALALSYQASFTWVRIFFSYGPGEAKNRLIPYIINQLLHNKEAYCKFGKDIRDFLYVKDMAYALALILNDEIKGIINIASGKPMHIEDIALTIARKLNREDLLKFETLPTIPSTHRIVADITRLKNELAWMPHFTVDQALEETIHWWQQQH